MFGKGEKIKRLKRDGWSQYYSPSTIDVHPGAKWCMRSKKVGNYGQQCCYNEEGELIKDKYCFASVTPDYSHFTNIPVLSGTHGSHYVNDNMAFEWAKYLDRGTFGKYNRLYNDVRPPDQGGGPKLRKEDCCVNGPK